MTAIKTWTTSLIVAACALVGFPTSAHAANAVNWIYNGNQLVEVDFDDGTSIQYGYDGNGNLISKTAGSTSQFYTITASAGTGGEIWPSGQTQAQVKVIAGGDYTFTFMPTTPGYYLSSVTVDGNSVGAPDSYTFTNVTANHTIAAVFSTGTYPITVSTVPANGSGGTITPGSQMVAQGGNQAFSISSNTGWYTTQVYVDGDAEGAITGYTFNNVTAPHTITAYFQIYTYTITTSTIGGGSISPSSPTVNYGSNATFTITPAQGVTTYDVQADGVSKGAITGYTFTNVTANHTVTANFNPVQNARTGATYEHLQDAYKAAASGETLKIVTGTLVENFTANQSITVTIDGGYAGGFGSNPGTTIISGPATINGGTVTMQNCAISN